MIPTILGIMLILRAGAVRSGQSVERIIAQLQGKIPAPPRASPAAEAISTHKALAALARAMPPPRYRGAQGSIRNSSSNSKRSSASTSRRTSAS